MASFTATCITALASVAAAETRAPLTSYVARKPSFSLQKLARDCMLHSVGLGLSSWFFTNPHIYYDELCIYNVILRHPAVYHTQHGNQMIPCSCRNLLVLMSGIQLQSWHPFCTPTSYRSKKTFYTISFISIVVPLIVSHFY